MTHANAERNNSMDEDRFARQDQQRYSGWSSAFIIAVIVIILGIVGSCLLSKVLTATRFGDFDGHTA